MERDDHLRGPRQGLHEAATSTSARTCAAPTPGLASEPAIEYLDLARRHRGRAAADPPHRRRGLPRRARAHELLGLQLDRLPRAARALRRDRHARRAGARVQGDGQGAAPRRHRGDPRRRLQPHRRGQPPRADARRSAASTTQSYYRLVPETPRFYMDYTGTGNSLNPVHPSVLRLIMDSLRYFVSECHVDGFRFDLASALAREFHEVDRLSAFFDIIHQDPILSQVKLIAEPWDVGEGGYQVGNFPVLWTEWNGLYRDVMRDFWRGAGARRRLRLPLHRLGRPLRARRPPPVRLDQLRHRPRRLHARRPRLLQREAQRGEPRGQPRRHRRQPQLELRRRGADRRPRGQRAPRAAAAQLPRDAVPLAGRADAARRRRARPHAGRQQQRLLPGQRDLLDRLGRSTSGSERLLEFTRRLIALRQRAPGVPARRASSPASASARRCPTSWWFRPDGRKMTRRDWERGGGPRLGVFLNGEELATRDAARASRSSTTRSWSSSTPTTRPIDVHAAAAPLRLALGARALDRRSRRRADDELRRRAAEVALESRSLRPAPARRDAASCARRTGSSSAPDSAFATRAASCRTCGSSASATSTSRRCCRRGAARRTATTSSTRAASRDELGGERRAARALRGRARRRSSTSSRTTWRRRRGEPVLARPGAAARGSSTSTTETGGTGASSTSTSSPASASRTPRCSRRRTRSCSTSSREGLVDGLRVDHPDGLADPRGYLERLRGEGVERVWVEKILEPGERAARLAGRGDDRLRVPGRRRRRSSSTRPARRSLDRARRRAAAWHEVAVEAKLEQATTTFQPEVERLRRLLDVPELERALASLPVYRTYVEPWSGRVERRRPRGGRPACRERLRRVLLLEEPGHDEFVTRFQQTTGAGDGEGRRGHGVLPLRPAARAERGRRRPGPLRPRGRRVPPRERRARARASRTACSPGRRTTRSAAPTCARASARSPAMAERWREHVARWHELERAAARRRRARLDRGAVRLPDARRRLADRARPARRRTSRRRCARRSATRAGSTRTSAWEARRASASRARSASTSRSSPTSSRSRRRSPAPASARRSASSCCG